MVTNFYSNVCRGRRQKENQDALIPCILEPDEDSKAYRKNWASFIQTTYEEAGSKTALPFCLNAYMLCFFCFG